VRPSLPALIRSSQTTGEPIARLLALPLPDFLVYFGGVSREFSSPSESRTIPSPAAAEPLKIASAPKGHAAGFHPKLLTLLYNSRIRVCPGPPSRPMGPKPPRWGEPPPRSRSRGRWDPEPALGLAIRLASTG